MDAYSKFVKILGLAAVALCVGAAVIAALWPALHAGFGVAGILLMALNALAAIGILRYRSLGIEPAKLVVISMIARLGLVAGVMLLVIRLTASGTALYSFMFSAMVGYVVFQAIEIRHLLRNPGLLSK